MGEFEIQQKYKK